MKAFLLYSKVVDKVIIVFERKGIILEAKGTKDGLAKMKHITPLLERTKFKDIEARVEELLIINIDYNVEFDVDVEDTNQFNTILHDWAEKGEFPKDEGGGWFDGNAKKDWNAIDRGMEENSE